MHIVRWVVFGLAVWVITAAAFSALWARAGSHLRERFGRSPSAEVLPAAPDAQID